MSSKIKSVIQYLLMISLAGVLLWLSLRGLQTGGDQNKTDLLWQTWEKSNKGYLILMAIIAMASHWLRAMRWRLLMIPTGHIVKTWSCFLSLMVGYLVNLGIPRGGEISRSYNLYKLEGTPVETSFGTVVTERIVDLICLVILLCFSFVVEWKNLMKFFTDLGIDKSSGSITIPIWIWIFPVILLAILLAYVYLRKNPKFLNILNGFKNGLLSILKLEQKGLFIIYSLLIWILYFLMTYSIMMAFEQTSQLGFGAVLILFAIGAIAMAIPLPGGLGSYHTLMPLGLVMIYNLPKTDATAFVFIFHGWQTLVMIIGGVFSLIYTYALLKTRNSKSRES